MKEMPKSRVRVRKMKKIAASVGDVLTNNQKQTHLVRGQCLKLLKICEEKGIEPEVLLFELYASVAVGEELLKRKQIAEVREKIEDELNENEVRKVEEDLSKVLKCIKTETATLVQITEVEEGSGRQERQRNNEEQEYVPSQERPFYIW
jgi:hypothetical protein